jgi:hypothetical protein
MCEILKQAPVSKENRVWMTCLEKDMPGWLINSRTSLKSHNLVRNTKIKLNLGVFAISKGLVKKP